jgi:hypothetical protein
MPYISLVSGYIAQEFSGAMPGEGLVFFNQSYVSQDVKPPCYKLGVEACFGPHFLCTLNITVPQDLPSTQVLLSAS